MGIVLVDGIEVEVGDQERLNGIQAAARAGIEVPHYCWHPGLAVVASCRMCLVETGTKNPETGAISMVPKVVPACQTPAKAGTVFVTNSPKVQQSRAFVEEALLIDHPIDCPICDKAGECNLQDYHFKYGQEQRRADIQPFHSRRRDMGDTVTLFVDRCVMCTRCVRFTREIAGDAELMVVNRGAHEEIDVFPGFPLANKLSGNVVDLCPVGALGDKDFLYKQRVWFMKSHEGVCNGCSTGCSIWTEENQGTVYRLKPRENPHVNQWWMCDEGRYGFHHANSPERIAGPWRRAADAKGNSPVPSGVAHAEGNGAALAGWTAMDWTVLFSELREKLAISPEKPAVGKLAVVLSPFLTVEEAYLLGTLARQLDPKAVVALGHVPVEGHDEKFKSGFTIRAEKCPNRKGVAEIVKRFDGILEFGEFLGKLDKGDFRAVWVAGGYKSGDWIDAATAARFDKLTTLVVQDLFNSPLAERAHYVLPATTFAERDGSYVNHGDRLQSFRWACRAPAGVRPEGSVYQYLLGRKGLYKAVDVLTEVAHVIPYFDAVSAGVPDVGVHLRVNQLAAT